MTSRTLAVATLTTLLLVGAEQARAQSNWKCKSGQDSAEVIIDEDHPILLASITPPPTTRVRLSIDRVDGSAHYEIEWDNAVPGSALRRLSPAYGTYKLTFWVQPQILQGLALKDRGSIYVSTNLNCFTAAAGGGWVAKGLPYDALSNSGLDLPPVEVTIERLSRGSGGSELKGRLDLDVAQSESSLRGLSDPISGGVERVLRLIAEIAIERAKSRGFALLKERVKKRLCTDFTWKALGLSQKDSVLPETCALIENMRMRDIASAGRPLLAALRSDLEASVLPILAGVALEKTLPEVGPKLSPLLRRIFKLASAVASDSPTSARDAQLLLSELARTAWEELEERTGLSQETWSALRALISGEEFDPLPLLSAVGGNALLQEGWTLLASKLDKPMFAALKDRLKKFTNEADLRDALKAAAKHPDEVDLTLAGRELWRSMSKSERLKLARVAAIAVLTRSKAAESVARHLAGRLGTLDAQTSQAVDAAFKAFAGAASSTSLASALTGTDKALRATAIAALLSEARQLFATFSEKYGPEVACGVQLVVAVANECIRRGGCSSSDIADMVSNAARHFVTGPQTANLPAVCFSAKAKLIDKVRAKWPTLDLVAERAVFLALPPKKATRADLVSASVDIAFELLDQLCKRRKKPCNAKIITGLRSTVDAIIAGDATLVITRSARLVGDLNLSGGKKLGQALELLTVFTAYATAEDSADKEEAERTQAARKAAIESLIDSATDRRGRSGDWVVSVGANPGFQAFGEQRLYGSDRKKSTERARLEMPFGFAVQKLPSKENGFFGLHFLLSPIDLAQYIPTTAETEGGQITESVDWYDLVSARGQIGLMIGSASNSLIVGAQLSWSPTLFERDVVGDMGQTTREAGVRRFGLFVSYYVPFFDLN